MCRKVRRHIKSHIRVILRHIYDIYKPLNKYGMKKLIVVALMLVGSLTYAHDLTVEEKKVIYDYIQLRLEQGEITLQEAQHLWLEHTSCCKE